MAAKADFDAESTASCGRVVPSYMYYWPFLVMFPSSLFFLTLDQMLVNTTYGRDDPNYVDVTCRMGHSPGIMLFWLCLVVGSGLLAAAVAGWVYEWWKTRRVNWAGVAWIVLGIAAHPWVMSLTWEIMERLILGERSIQDTY